MSTTHDPLRGAIPELAELPQDTRLAFVKGAVDGLLQHTTAVWDNGTAVAFDDAWNARISAGNDALAAAGMRVLGVAFRPLEFRTATTPSPTSSCSASSASSTRPAPRSATPSPCAVGPASDR